ncbi:MAG: hypothetical protein JSR77_05050 [Planctomycetes bacterium]|nr:hypothetical protein [Planctomycetota bacterium]
MKKTLVATATAIACMASIAGTASATTRSSFTDVAGISGISALVSNSGLSYTITVGNSASFTLNNVNYPIANVIGFYVLSDDIDFSPLPALANMGPPGAFSDDSTNSGTGAAAGWKSNPNNGLNLGQALTFNFPANFPISAIDRIGFHVRLVSGNFPGTSGNTGNITGALIPAPATAGLVGMGGLLAMKRRRRA